MPSNMARVKEPGHEHIWLLSAALGLVSFLAFSVFATPLLSSIWAVFIGAVWNLPWQLINILNRHLFIAALLLALPFLVLRRETGIWFLGLAVFAGLYIANKTFGSLLRADQVSQPWFMIVGFFALYSALATAFVAFWSGRQVAPVQLATPVSIGLWGASICLLCLGLFVQIYDVPNIIRILVERQGDISLGGRLFQRHTLQPQFYPIILGLVALGLRRRPAIPLMVLSLLMLSGDLMQVWGGQIGGQVGTSAVLVTLTFVFVLASLVCFWRAGTLKG